MKKSVWMLVAFVVLGGLLGGILGEILRIIAPPGTIQNIFSKAVSPGLNPPMVIDLVFLNITLGFWLKMNLLTFLGMVLGLYLYKQV